MNIWNKKLGVLAPDLVGALALIKMLDYYHRSNDRNGTDKRQWYALYSQNSTQKTVLCLTFIVSPGNVTQPKKSD